MQAAHCRGHRRSAVDDQHHPHRSLRQCRRDGDPGSDQKRWPWVKHLYADGAYDRLTLMDKAAYLRFVLEIIRRSEQQKGFQVLPRRWVVERTLMRMLTDRGSEYCGNPERHEYELCLAIEDVDYTRTKTKSPQTNGICERFHKTALNEFYRVAFRKKG